MAKKKQMDRLTYDVLAAQRAGMSYGQYKAQHPVTTDELPEIQVEDELPVYEEPVYTCTVCGARFTREQNPSKKYCTPRCCALARYNRRKAKASAAAKK